MSKWFQLIRSFFWLLPRWLWFKVRQAAGFIEPWQFGIPASQATLEVRKGRVGLYKPKPGYTFNPLLKLPPNFNCFCGKKVKTKKCCLPKLKRAVPEEQAVSLMKYVAYRTRMGI